MGVAKGQQVVNLTGIADSLTRYISAIRLHIWHLCKVFSW